MAQLHSLLLANHRPYAGVYADATERTAATGFVRALGGDVVPFTADDLYKTVLQIDNATEWVLTAITPTWVQVGGNGLIPAVHATSHQNGGSDEISVAGLSGVLADPQVPITENVQDIVGALFIDNSDLDLTYDDGTESIVATIKPSAAPLSPATVTLTDGATVTWATAGARQNNARVTLGGNRILDITGEVDGATGLLIVIQDGTGGWTLTLPAGSLVINGGGGAVTLSTGAGDIDILTWYFDGTNFFWTLGTDYS